MHTLRPIIAAIAALAVHAATAEPLAAYQPFAYLAGHCWRGAVGAGKATDEHCFTWVYDGKFLRDRHVVHAEGHPDYAGETLYVWNPATSSIEYLYIENEGGHSRGTVTTDGTTLVFPEAHYVDADGSAVYRSRWQRAGDDAYDVTTEFQTKTGWAPPAKVHMVRVSD